MKPIDPYRPVLTCIRLHKRLHQTAAKSSHAERPVDHTGKVNEMIEETDFSVSSVSFRLKASPKAFDDQILSDHSCRLYFLNFSIVFLSFFFWNLEFLKFLS